MGRRGLGSLPRPKLRPGAVHALLWMLYIAEVAQYGIPHQLTTGDRCLRPSDSVGFETGQPQPLPPVPPCSCRYRVYTTSVVRFATRIRPPRQRLVTGTGFDVDPGCEHHGDLRRVEYFDATYLFGDVLDEDERRNH